MKWMLVFLVACGTSDAKPGKPNLAGMTADQKCKATAPRGEQCADMLYNRHIAQQFGEKKMKEIEERKAATDKEAKMLHDQACTDADYADHLAACWDEPDCVAVAKCVYPMKKQ